MKTVITTDFQVEGDFPRYGNDDDRADEIATTLLSTFLEKLKHYPYLPLIPSQPTSILTITSNVVYGKATGSLRMEEKQVNLLHLVQIHLTVQSRTVFLLP